MTTNFDEILEELSFRVPEGIVDLSKEDHVNELIKVLNENKVYNANEIAQKARVFFGYLNEVGDDAKKLGSKVGIKLLGFKLVNICKKK